MDLNELKLFLDKSLTKNNSKEREALLIKLKNDLLINTLIEILENKKSLEKIARQSYRHNNGFIKILIIDNRPKYSLRLHLWDKKSSISNIHNHEWDLSGIVLYGLYRWQLFNVKEEDTNIKLNKYKCVYENSYRGHKFINKGKVLLEKYFDINISKDSVYSISGETFHKIDNSSEFDSASLVIHSEVKKNDIYVFSEERLETKHSHFNNCFSIEELEDILKNFLKKVLKNNGN